jgi:hypothetical protein
MSCFGGSLTFVLAGQKPQATKQEPRNLPPTKTCQVLVMRPNTHFDARVAQARETYPTESCNISRAMFQPQLRISHVPPCDPHPCPMTHP